MLTARVTFVSTIHIVWSTVLPLNETANHREVPAIAASHS